LKLRHIILTRFSMRASFGFGDEPFPISWLEERVELLEDYALGGMREQTAKEFDWLLLCDESTDSSCLARLAGLARDVPQLRLGIINRARTWRKAMNELLDDDHDVLLTTRVDSDDALNVRYVESVQRYAAGFLAADLDRLVVNFPRGLQYDSASGRLFARQYPHSPFPTMIERAPLDGKPVTVHSAQHTDLPKQWPTHQDVSIDGWLQVIHGGNVKNEIAPDAVEIDRDELSGQFVVTETPRAG
jgi:hypothetical protein